MNNETVSSQERSRLSGERLPWAHGNAQVITDNQGISVLKNETKKWRRYGDDRGWMSERSRRR